MRKLVIALALLAVPLSCDQGVYDCPILLSWQVKRAAVADIFNPNYDLNLNLQCLAD